MKTKKSLLVACFVGLTMAFGLAGASLAIDNEYAAGGGIVGSAHDMTAIGITGTLLGAERGPCSYCHTPHHALFDGDNPYQPLWSRPDIANDTFAQYDSTTFDAGNNMGAGGNEDWTAPLAGPTRLCLSCHDGVVAIDSNYGQAGTAKSDRENGDTWNGIDIVQGFGLSNDHPVGFDYEAVAAVDAEIKSAPTFPGSNVPVADVLTTVDVGFGPEDFMTCSTCHDVHNSQSVEDYLLYAPRAGSALCLTCHDK